MKILGACRLVDVFAEWGSHNTEWRLGRTVSHAADAVEVALTYYAQLVGRVLSALPAHQRCHGGLNEGWLRNLLVPLAAGSPSQSAAALYSGSVWRAFANDVGLRRQTLAGLVRAEDVYSPGGVYLGTAPALRFEGKRVYPSLEKMLRGLYLHRTDRPLARDAVFKWRPNPIEYGRLAEYFQASAPGLCYGDVFDSRFLFAKATGLDASVWWLRFYRGPVFRCFVTSPVLALAPTA